MAASLKTHFFHKHFCCYWRKATVGQFQLLISFCIQQVFLTDSFCFSLEQCAAWALPSLSPVPTLGKRRGKYRQCPCTKEFEEKVWAWHPPWNIKGEAHSIDTGPQARGLWSIHFKKLCTLDIFHSHIFTVSTNRVVLAITLISWKTMNFIF